VRILHVIQEMRTGGAERVVVSLARGAQAAGHPVAVASAPGELLAELDAVEHFPLPLLGRRPTAVPGAALQLRQALRQWEPHIAHCHNPGMGIVTSLATLRGRMPKALVSVHGVPDEDWRRTTRVLRLAGLPAVACGPGVEVALAEHGLPAAATIWNGVSPAPPPADRAELKRTWRIPREHKLVLAVGRLVPAKNHAVAIQAFAEVNDATLVIVGEGALRNELEDEARQAGVHDRVVFAGLRPDARALIGAADAIVVSSRSEGLPMVVLEALAAGTPIVATAVRGVREILEDERNALVTPPDDPVRLAQALRRIVSDDQLAGRLASTGRGVAAEHTEEAMVDAFLDLYARRAA
jgi:glycosyltransferase involved in cell wall biosynthesis